MAEYIVDSSDQLSESILVNYRNERVGTQTTVAQVHGAIREGLAAEEKFNALIAPGGPLEAMAAYHAAKVAPVAASLDSLRAAMVQVQQAMEALESAVPGLFPGVSV